QYLMGFRTPDEVPPPFLVTGPGRSFATRLPQVGVSFDGQRRDVSAAEIIAAEGRRTPDSTVSQRRFRFAFILIVPEGATPSQAAPEKNRSTPAAVGNFFGPPCSRPAVRRYSASLELASLDLSRIRRSGRTVHCSHGLDSEARGCATEDSLKHANRSRQSRSV